MITEEQKERDRDLEGKEIRVQSESGAVAIGIVTGIDYDLGITLQAKDDKRYFLCHNGPSSPIAKEIPKYNPNYHNKIYSAIVAMIREGEVRLDELWRQVTAIKKSTPGIYPSAANCPFSQ